MKNGLLKIFDGLDAGDEIIIKRRFSDQTEKRIGFEKIEGRFLKRWGDRPSLISVKMKNGYNISIDISSIEGVEMSERKIISTEKLGAQTPKKDLPKVSLVQTGGTIASSVDYDTGGVKPARDLLDFKNFAPEVEDICKLESTAPISLLSENIGVKHWEMIANEVVGAFDKGARGVVISHGTDTMAYTSSALSIMLMDLPGPVVLVGSQRSSDRPASDAKKNLLDACRVCTKGDLMGVYVLMHGSISDDISLLHRGDTVSKLHTSRRDSFQSIDRLPVGFVKNGEVRLLRRFEKTTQGRNPSFHSHMDRNISLIKIHPGIDVDDIERMSGKKSAILIEGTGLGNIPDRLIPAIVKEIRRGKPVVMKSQCPYGKCDLNVYSTGRKVKETGVIDAGSMTTETTLAIMMKIMGEIDHTLPNKRKIDLFSEVFLSYRSERIERNLVYGFGEQYFETIERWRRKN